MAPDCHLGGGMAHLHRLILVILFGWACLGAPGIASAQFAPQYEYRASDGTITTQWFSTPSAANEDYWAQLQSLQNQTCTSNRNEVIRYVAGAATETSGSAIRYADVYELDCSAIVLVRQSNHAVPITRRGGSCPVNSTGTTTCTCDPGYQPISGGYGCEPVPPPDCPATSTRINGVCVPDPPCPDGYVRMNGVCKKPPKCPPAGTDGGEWDDYTRGGSTACFAGCQYNLAPADFGWGSPTRWRHSSTYTGAECSGTTDGAGSGSGDGSGSGSGSGSGEGTGNTGGGTGAPPPEKVPPGEPAPPPPDPKPENPDGTCPAGTTKTNGACISNPTPPNGDGVCPAGSVKVDGTCVFSVPGGGGSGSGSGTGSGTGTGTGEGSAFAGNCAAGFACTGGDAIQCAIAKEQYVRNCKLFDDQSSSAAQRYLAATSGAPTSATDGLPGNETVNLGPSRFDQSDALGVGGSGMSDLTVVVMGSSISLPFSRINPYLAMFGNVLVAVSLILAARIVARG